MRQPFGFGRVIGAGFRIWGRRLPPILVLAAIVQSPMIVSGFIASADGVWHRTFWWLTWSPLIQPLLDYLLSAVFSGGVATALRREPCSFSAFVADGATRLLPAFFTSLLVALCAVVWSIAVSFMFFLLPPFAAALVGIVIREIPGCFLFVAAVASVRERRGPFAAVARSVRLTRDHRFGLLAIELLIVCLGMVVSGVLRVSLESAPAVFVYAEMIRRSLVATLGATMMCVAFVDLRNAKEGPPAEQVATVFE